MDPLALIVTLFGLAVGMFVSFVLGMKFEEERPISNPYRIQCPNCGGDAHVVREVTHEHNAT